MHNDFLANIHPSEITNIYTLLERGRRRRHFFLHLPHLIPIPPSLVFIFLILHRAKENAAFSGQKTIQKRVLARHHSEAVLAVSIFPLIVIGDAKSAYLLLPGPF